MPLFHFLSNQMIDIKNEILDACYIGYLKAPLHFHDRGQLLAEEGNRPVVR